MREMSFPPEGDRGLERSGPCCEDRTWDSEFLQLCYVGKGLFLFLSRWSPQQRASPGEVWGCPHPGDFADLIPPSPCSSTEYGMPSVTFGNVHPSDVLDMPVDPNEPTYCLCHQVSYGEMIGCDNPDVRYWAWREWGRGETHTGNLVLLMWALLSQAVTPAG